MIAKRWELNNKINQKEVEKLSSAMELPFLTVEILMSRGLENKEVIERFLEPKVSDLKNPFLFKNMENIVNRINKAIENNENIWVYGDYDVDGITSVSILINYFKSIDVDIDYYIPNRKKEGYGLNNKSLDYIKNNGGDLIITVDCGISSIKEVDYCKELSMDIIITDHHTCGENLPNAYGILNPKVSGDNYPYDMLAGVGIAFKLVQALSAENFKNIYKEYIDIVAFGTIADIAPLDGENRVITAIGLKNIKDSKNIGILSLIKVSELENKEITSGIIGYRLAPQINAAGRLGEPNLAVDLLTTDSSEVAMDIAKRLFQLNEQRKMIEKAIFIKSINVIEKNTNLEKEPIIVVYGENWHSGVIGIVASRLTEKYLKPAIVLTKEEGFVKGSARSIGDLNIYDTINSVSELLLGFGGHKMAAGLKMEVDNVEKFKNSINNYVLENVEPEKLRPKIKYDGLIDLSDVTIETIKALEKLKPFGVGNPKPKFVVNSSKVLESYTVGKDNSHLKIMVKQNQLSRPAIGFNLGFKNKELVSGDKVNLLVSLDINEYNGIVSPQLVLKDIKKDFCESSNISFFDKTKYYQSLFLSLKENLSYYKNISFKQVNFGEEDLNFEDENVLILINSINALEEFNKSNINNFRLHYNEVLNKTSLDVLINPVLRKIALKDYNRIIFYDIPIRNLRPQLSNHMTKERFNFLIGLFKGIPKKEEIVIIYKYFKKNKKLLLEDCKKNLKLNSIKVIISLELLREISVLKYSIDSQMINVEFPSTHKNKQKIEDNKIYKELLKIKRNVM